MRLRRMPALLLAVLLLWGVSAGLAEETADTAETVIESEEEARVLQYGDTGEDVRELQQKLTDLYYYTGNISGRYREGTRAAVKAFQEDFGLEATGIADAQTQSVLFSTLYRPLQYGSSGEDVRRMQTRLTELGYYKGKISGNYLEGTQYAIKRFQGKVGLEATGKADPETQAVLYSSDALAADADENLGKYATATPEPQVTSTPAPGTGFVVDDAADTQEIPESAAAFPGQLQKNDTGDTVKQLQTRLTELGYYSGPISGNFLGKTATAVKKVQTQNGLEETGVVDEATWNVIFNDAGVVLPDATPKPTPEP